MNASSDKRPSLHKRRLALLFMGLIIVVGIYLLLKDVHVMYATADNGDVLIAERISSDTTFSSRYLHSVVKCPIIEKYVVGDDYEMVLMESWNCSFGAGIETEPPPGATDRLEDGFYVIDQIDKPFQEVLFHPVSIAEQVLTIDGEKWDISNEPFEGRTFSLQIEKENWLTYLWKRRS
ncbi:DUF1850 domain-containing protein [Lentibacillus salicampi]|uniref:DUF1850 domain-containing protein n=1 Tax=Lentibacillus salicampi TaxID=175306 RepID=A0A4Y9AAB0_9BACI|nr:DUF1850 domain-containing protein [Lentibacillus salicampi]TFJ91271.1 DUF1850 domain-containing protein [Lentibacillus salicampi]